MIRSLAALRDDDPFGVEEEISPRGTDQLNNLWGGRSSKYGHIAW
ncbi:hypothetical protein [Daejeonella sp.]